MKWKTIWTGVGSLQILLSCCLADGAEESLVDGDTSNDLSDTQQHLPNVQKSSSKGKTRQVSVND